METAIPARTIDLSQETRFRLAGLEIRPATLEVITPTGREQLEPRIMQVLVALARRRGEVVSRDELTATCWGGRVVGDDCINRCILRLRKLAETAGGFAITTVPRVGFRLSETGGAEGDARAPWRPRTLLAALAAVVLIVTVAAVALWRISNERGPPTLHVAVRAFDTIDKDAASQAIAARMTDTVAGVLTENVIAVAAPGAATDAADVIVGGVVSREGGRLRVRAYLADPRSRATLWSGQFERPEADEAALRDAVAVGAGEAISTAIEASGQRGLKLDAPTMALVIKASNATVAPDALTPDEGVRAAEQVVARAPAFGAGHARLALKLVPLRSDAERDAGKAAMVRLRKEAATAIRLSPDTSGAAWESLYRLARLDHPTDLVAAEDVLLAGLRADPDYPFLGMRECVMLIGVGRVAEGMRYCERALAQRPLAAPIAQNHAYALSQFGRPDLAEQVIARSFRFHPDDYVTRWRRLELAVFYGSPETALAILQDPAQRPPYLRDVEIAALETFVRARGASASADQTRAFDAIRAVSANGRYTVMAAAMFGRLDDAFAALRDLRLDGELMGPLLFEPLLAPVRRDSRFWPVAARAGLVTYWRKRGVWPDFCADPTLPYDCRKEAAKHPG